MNVALLGASDKPDRFAYKALKKLQAFGHRVFLVNPRLKAVDGETVWPDLSAIPETVDTVTLYVSAANSNPHQEAMLQIKPRRVIFNPGTENPGLETALLTAGIEAVHDCTLLMLDGGRFD